jgi:hypothetical protein
MQRRVVWSKVTNVSEEYTAFIFRVEVNPEDGGSKKVRKATPTIR